MRNITKLLALCLMVCVALAISACVATPKHAFSADWNNDAENHWHACTDEGCEEKSDVAAHTYGEGVVTTPATEDAEGVMTYKCTVCGYAKIEAIEKLDHVHTEEVIPGQAATCTEAGLTNGKKCSACGEIIVAQEAIAALGHSEQVVAGSAATCTEAGLTDGKVCTVCGVTTLAQEVIPAKGHKDEDNNFKCDVCGAELCTNHTAGEATKENEQAATCTAAGSYESVVKCSVCSVEMSRETVSVPALGHTNGAVVVENNTDATCTAAGSYDNVVYCTVCNTEVSRDTVSVSALGHTNGAVVVENNTDATCIAAGSYDNVVYCTVCNAEVSRDTVSVPALGHTNGAAVEENRTESTCTVAGSYDSVVYCTVCSAEVSRNTVALALANHTAGATVKENEAAATCTAAGSYDNVVKCSVCGAEMSRETVNVDALGHTNSAAVEENRTESTCTVAGSYDLVVYCSVCNDELDRDTVTLEVVDHTAGATVKENEVVANCQTAGSYDNVVKCSVCGVELSREHVVTAKVACGDCGKCNDADCTITNDKCVCKVVHIVPNYILGAPEGPDGLAPGKSGAYLYDESITAERVVLENGKTAIKVTLPNGTAAHSGVSFCNNKEYDTAGLAGYSCGAPVIANVTKPITMYFTNTGSSTLSFKYSAIDYYYDKGAIEVVLEPGESKAVVLNVVFDKASIGLNHQIVFPNGSEAGSLTIYGEYLVDENLASMSVIGSADQVRFGVGETFSAEGLVLKLSGTGYDRVYVSDNFYTHLDGYTFTADDIGTRTVFVFFGGKVATYNIIVDDHDHNIQYVAATEVVPCVSDAVAAHYICTVDGCDLYFDDAYGNKIIDAPAAVSCHTAGDAAVLPGSSIKCANCGVETGEKTSTDNWVIFRPDKDLSQTGITGFSSAYGDVDGVYGVKYTFGAGATAGQQVQLKFDNNESGMQTIVPNAVSDPNLRKIIMYYHNYGTEDITIKFENDNDGAHDLVTIPAGQTVVSSYTNTRTQGGRNYYYLKLLSDVTTDVTVGVYGYMYVEASEVTNSFVIAGESTHKTTFTVGETFSSEGLRIWTSGGINSMFIASGFRTDFDGKVFTNSDTGTHTVSLTYGSRVLNYTITVIGECETVGHEYVEKNDQSLFVEMNGTDAMYKRVCLACGAISEEAYAATKVGFVPHNAIAGGHTVEYVTLDDGRVAAKLTFNSDVAAGTVFQIKASSPLTDVNTCFPVNTGVERRVYFEMLSSANINIKWTPEYYNDRDGLDFDLTADQALGQTWTIMYNTHASYTATDLCYQEITCNSDVAAGTVVYITGYFYACGEIESLNAKLECDRVFKVGEQFNADGLFFTINTKVAKYDRTKVYNFETNLDGYTFTADDLGVHKVIVTVCGTTYEYEILVTE